MCDKKIRWLKKAQRELKAIEGNQGDEGRKRHEKAARG